jgi:hypothetical protein
MSWILNRWTVLLAAAFSTPSALELAQQAVNAAACCICCCCGEPCPCSCNSCCP